MLLFDLSGVLFNDGLSVAVEHINKKFNIDKEEIREVLNGKCAHNYRKGLEEPEEFWKKANKRLGHDVKQIFFDSYNMDKEIAEFIRPLGNVGFISNSPKDRVEYLDKKYDFLSMFRYGLFSYEAHHMKPSIEIFKLFLEKFRLYAEQITYIDDLEKNLEPASKLGMKTILFIDLDELKEQIKQSIQEEE